MKDDDDVVGKGVPTPDSLPNQNSPAPDSPFAPTIDHLPIAAPFHHEVTTPYLDSSSLADARVDSPAPGPLVGEYELLGEIARGGMGVVYKARHRKLNRIAALKLTRAGDTALGSQRFQAEAEAAAKLDHPNIVPIYEVGEANGQQFLAMAFVEGASLSESIATGPLPPRRAAELMKSVALAVAYAHAHGVIHRDLKPGNILLDAASQPRVTDFGLAKRADADSSLTQAGQIMGTPNYMPPEQAEGKNDRVGPLADVYSLGATLYCLITGRPPFQSANVIDTLKQVVEREPAPPRLLNPAVGRDLDTICLKCLEKRPEKRYSSATALAEDLQRFLEKRSILARPVGQSEKLLRWCRRNPLSAASLAGIVAILVTAFVLVSWSYVRAENARRVAEEQQKAERWERYRANMIAASSAMQLHNVSAAKSALDAAPEEHRNWEWRYFQNQFDTSLRVFRFSDAIRTITISPDGTVAAVQAANGPIRLWNLGTGEEIGSLNAMAPALAFTFSPDGKILASEHEDRLVLWDLPSRKERAILRTVGTRMNRPHFSPDGARLVAISAERSPAVWDTATGKQLVVLRGLEDSVAEFDFSPDGRRIVSAAHGDRTARIWNAETGEAQAVLKGHDANVSQAHFSPQGDRVLSVEVYPGNKLRLWDAKTGQQLAELRGHTNAAEKAAFSPDGTRIASGGLDRSIRLWDARSGQALSSREGHRGAITSLEFSPDGKYLITASHDQTARVWDGITGAPLGVLHGHTGSIYDAGARYSADGRTIVTASAADGTVRLWDARRAEWNDALRGHDNFVYSVAFHPDGERVASAGWDGTIRIWNASTGRPFPPLIYPFPRATEFKVVGSVAFHPAGKLVAAFGRDGAVRFWDLATAKEDFHFQMPPEHAYSGDSRMALSSGGHLLAAAAGDSHTVHVWDVERRAKIAVLNGHHSWVLEVCFSPNDAWLATCGSDRTVRIWDAATWQPIQVLEGHTAEIHAVTVSRDGKWLASGSTDGTVRLWDTTTWKQVAELKHGTIIYGVAFTPDGTRLASACANDMIRFWDTKTFQQVADLQGHGAYVHQIAFSPDGTRMVSGSGDMTVRVWDSLSVSERTQRSGLPGTPPRGK